MRKLSVLASVSLFAMAACSHAGGMVVDGPVSPPEKPVYQPYVPDMPAMDDFILSAGSNTVVFQTDSSKLDAIARETLDRQAAWIMTHYDKEILVEGHADERAPDDYNLGLGRRRAKAVVDYFTSKGLTRARFTYRSFGEGKPVIDEPGDIQINRRAVTVILGEEATDSVVDNARGINVKPADEN